MAFSEQCSEIKFGCFFGCITLPEFLDVDLSVLGLAHLWLHSLLFKVESSLLGQVSKKLICQWGKCRVVPFGVLPLGSNSQLSLVQLDLSVIIVDRNLGPGTFLNESLRTKSIIGLVLEGTEHVKLVVHHCKGDCNFLLFFEKQIISYQYYVLKRFE